MFLLPFGRPRGLLGVGTSLGSFCKDRWDSQRCRSPLPQPSSGVPAPPPESTGTLAGDPWDSGSPPDFLLQSLSASFSVTARTPEGLWEGCHGGRKTQGRSVHTPAQPLTSSQILGQMLNEDRTSLQHWAVITAHRTPTPTRRHRCREGKGCPLPLEGASSSTCKPDALQVTS